MAFDVEGFIHNMLGTDQAQFYSTLTHFEESKLTIEEKRTLYVSVNDLYKATRKSDPDYSSVLFLAGLVHADGIGHKISFSQAVPILKEAIDLENSAAMLLLAKIYFKTSGPNEEGLKLLEHAVKQKNPMAMYTLAQYYIDQNNYAAAVQLLDEAITLNHSNSMVAKAKLLITNKLGNPDILGAIELYYQAVKANNVSAMVLLASIFSESGGHIDYEEAIRLLSKAAGFENPVALNNLGYMYEHGQGCSHPDPEAAKILYDQAIALGNLVAAYNKAMLLVKEKKYDDAIPLLTKCIQAGDAAAMIRRAKMHENGWGGPILIQEANRLYEQAYALGRRDIPRRAMLIIYEKKAQYKLAIQLCDEGIANNESQAMVYRAQFYIRGIGGPSNNYAAAIELYDRAIKLGDAEAMFHRALLHEQGYPPSYKPNPREALKFYEQAVLLGHLPSMSKAAEIYRKQQTTSSMVRFRILYILAYPHNYLGRQKGEDLGFYHTVANNVSTRVTTDSIYQLGLALHYLKSLPSKPSHIDEIKTYILRAVELHIIPKFSALNNFHEMTSSLDGKTIDALMFLMVEYAKLNYTAEGQNEVANAFDYKLISESKDPKALRTLKALAAHFPKLFYWVGMSYLNTNRPESFFTKSGRDEAISWFKKAASDLNKDQGTKELAVAQLHKLGVRSSINRVVAPAIEVPPPAYPVVPLLAKVPDHSQYVAAEKPASSTSQTKGADAAPSINATPAAQNKTVKPRPPIAPISYPPLIELSFPSTPREIPAIDYDDGLDDEPDVKNQERVALLS